MNRSALFASAALLCSLALAPAALAQAAKPQAQAAKEEAFTPGLEIGMEVLHAKREVLREGKFEAAAESDAVGDILLRPAELHWSEG